MNVAYFNPYGVCDCPVPNCGCSGGVTSYLKPYCRLIDIVSPRSVFEWGPGENTRIALKSGASVVSVEQQVQWVPNIHHEKWVCILAPVSSPSYLSFVADYPNSDIYFTDSRRRTDCLRAIRDHCAKSESIIVVHDAQRKRYQEELLKFKYVIFVQKGLALASNSESLEGIAKQINPDFAENAK